MIAFLLILIPLVCGIVTLFLASKDAAKGVGAVNITMYARGIHHRRLFRNRQPASV